MVMAKKNTLLKNENKKFHAELNRKKHRAVIARMVIMILVDLVGILLLRRLAGDFSLEIVFHNTWLAPLTVVFGVLSAAALVYQIAAIVKKIDTATHFVTPAMILCVMLFCFLACLLYEHLLLMTIMIASAVATVLFVVYCLYMHIFYR